MRVQQRGKVFELETVAFVRLVVARAERETRREHLRGEVSFA